MRLRLLEQGLLPLGNRGLHGEEVGDVSERHPPPRPAEPLQLEAPDSHAMRMGDGGRWRQILLVGAVNCHLEEELPLSGLGFGDVLGGEVSRLELGMGLEGSSMGICNEGKREEEGGG